MSKIINAKPFVKWAGGKSQILDEIRRKYPVGLGASITKYAEPFVGGGAVFFDVLANYEIAEAYISDINSELIHTYKTIRDDVDMLLDALRMLETEYLQASKVNRKTIYYRNRNRFNTLKAERSNSAELAALLIFLNRTCFNGLYRVNSRGEFNVPQGSYQNPTICDENNLRAVSAKLCGVKIVCGDYKLSHKFIDKNTFAYFDPPYRPLTATANFTAYSNDAFGDKQQIKLAQFIDEMSDHGAWVVASNSDPKNTDENDEFFDNLYAKHSILRIEATRAINSAATKRGCVRELLIARRQ
ncbi:MAG: DNA adenine methylase [Planctomycetaceae bacterium]|jgi:DNA adenine methylase|nr:DNA adenine methylase [Planctomycetaceae bacterium]